MKKIFSIISILGCALFGAYASPVSQNDAQKTANAFFGSSNATLAMAEAQTKSSVAPAYYVFNNPNGGWVIIAGDDCCEPVLGFAQAGKFSSENLPSNFKSWMNGISKNVGKVRSAGLAPKTEIKTKWASVGATKATASQTVLQTASWGQGSPYYNNCPTYKSSKCATGCVATAMAIVLRYNQYPTSGTGTIPAYTTETNEISVAAITLGTNYDWANMPLVYGSSATTAQKTAVATLMQHCGAMVQMDYDPEGSGAYSEDIIPALAKYMGYSKGAMELYRYNYSNADWFRMIKAEIDANRPMIYGGSDATDLEYGGGHQFVLDGYNSDNMVHVNWGWDGEINGWYAVNYLGDSTNGVYSYTDSGIFGLKPENGATSQMPEIALEAYDTMKGISLAGGTIAKGSTFTIDLGDICNYDYNNAYSGSIKVGLYDKDGKLKEYVSSEQTVSLDKAEASWYSIEPAYTDIQGLSCKITETIALGDYLMAVYKGSDGSWLPLGGYSSDEATTNYDSQYEYYTLYKLGVFDLAYLNVPQTVTSGQVIYFDLVGSHKLPSTIVWYWDGNKNTNRFVKATSGKHTLKAVVTYSDSSTETVQQVINVQ